MFIEWLSIMQTFWNYAIAPAALTPYRVTVGLRWAKAQSNYFVRCYWFYVDVKLIQVKKDHKN